MSQNKSCSVSTISILLLAAGPAILAPDRAGAQAVQPTPTLNTKINQLRLNSRIFHPEHGEVPLEALGKLDYGADKPGLELNRYLSIFVSDVDTTKAIKFSDVMGQLVNKAAILSSRKISCFISGGTLPDKGLVFSWARTAMTMRRQCRTPELPTIQRLPISITFHIVVLAWSRARRRAILSPKKVRSMPVKTPTKAHTAR